MDPPKLELFWRRLEDAKLQLDHCHNYVREIKQDKSSGAVPFSDANDAGIYALRAEKLALEKYLSALNDFQAALILERERDSRSVTKELAVQMADRTQFDIAITPREREVLVLIASGKSSKQIAAHLGIAFRTVACYRYRLQTKLKIHNTADLTRAALQMGLIEL